MFQRFLRVVVVAKLAAQPSDCVETDIVSWECLVVSWQCHVHQHQYSTVFSANDAALAECWQAALTRQYMYDKIIYRGRELGFITLQCFPITLTDLTHR